MSTIRVNAIQDTAGVERFTARAWVNFNGQGTVAIRASGNVSSITDLGVGNYQVNFTNALTDANYAGVFTTSEGSWTTAAAVISQTASACAFYASSGTTYQDVARVNATFFR